MKIINVNLKGPAPNCDHWGIFHNTYCLGPSKQCACDIYFSISLRQTSHLPQIRTKGIHSMENIKLLRHSVINKLLIALLMIYSTSPVEASTLGQFKAQMLKLHKILVAQRIAMNKVITSLSEEDFKKVNSITLFEKSLGSNIDEAFNKLDSAEVAIDKANIMLEDVK